MNCQTAGLNCVFPPSKTNTSTPTSEPVPTARVSPEPSTPDSQPSQTSGSIQASVIPQFTPGAYVDPAVNFQHLELLHHFVTSTCLTFTDDQAILDVWKGPVIRIGLAFPFLMHEVLAISALHLAYCKPEHAPRYYTISTELQSQALKSFNSSHLVIDASSCAAVLMFTPLLALHVLADPSPGHQH